MKQLILGGARSGKSALAERITAQYGSEIAYIATANTQFNDDEMDARISYHQAQRPGHWETFECPLSLPEQLRQIDGQYDGIMIDCLTLWVSNCLLQENIDWSERKQSLADAINHSTTPVIMVSNEVGMGVVPMGEISRQFVDESGFLHQALATLCDRVVFVAAGLPLVMKGKPIEGVQI